MDSEFTLPISIEELVVRQVRSVSHNEFDNEVALEEGKIWKWAFAERLEQLAYAAEEGLIILNYDPSNPEAAVAAMNRFWELVARSSEISRLIVPDEGQHRVPYLCQLTGFYGQSEDPGECRNYLELLVELGRP